MARLSAVVRAPLLLTVGLAACSGGGSDFPISPTGGADAATDTGPPATRPRTPRPPDAAVVATDAMLDASGPGPDAAPGAELSIAIR
jgi:hypothetical protein